MDFWAGRGDVFNWLMGTKAVAVKLDEMCFGIYALPGQVVVGNIHQVLDEDADLEAIEDLVDVVDGYNAALGMDRFLLDQ
jgi:hypothetical protein